ncbi:hypothetical protein [uncultured Butyricimonas sp.]|uniref:hypothetical protein n=1 Tax=uncultured Butyricimonas sp. TaxID=1268785 RepID=UPI0026DDA21E|nr:hypothetical protein [uncultured Butyricimonas sp.]
MTQLSRGEEELLRIIEDEKLLYKYKIYGISVWTIVRRRYRQLRLEKICGIASMSNHAHFNFKRLLLTFFVSLRQFIHFLLKRKQVDIWFLNFTRLDCANGIWLDKFIDPIIDELGLSNYICFERGNSGVHRKPRLHQNSIVYTEVIDFSVNLLEILVSPFYYLRYRKVYLGLFNAAQNSFFMRRKDFWQIVRLFARFDIKRRIFKNVFRRKHVKYLLGVARSGFYPEMVACKELGIPVFEFQHGITVGETVLYSGSVDEMFVPDYFLAFGKMWVGAQFGINCERIKVIGWAYRDYLRKTLAAISKKEKYILFASEPEISDKIISAVTGLAKAFPDYFFDIRLHPQERFKSGQNAIIETIPNVRVVDNKIGSFVALMQYDYVAGEHSTVLYEAMSLGKKVAKICFADLHPKSLIDNYDDGFYYVHNIEEFGLFLKTELNESQKEKMSQIYSPFDKEGFLNLLGCDS